MSKQQSEVPCHWKCQTSDPRRQILADMCAIEYVGDHKRRFLDALDALERKLGG